MNRTSFFGRLGAILAAPIATPLAKALAPTSTEAPMAARYFPGIAGTVRLGQGAAYLGPSTPGLTVADFNAAPDLYRLAFSAAEYTWDGTRWLPPANTLP